MLPGHSGALLWAAKPRFRPSGCRRRKPLERRPGPLPAAPSNCCIERYSFTRVGPFEGKEDTMKLTGFSFGKLRVDGDEYTKDLIIDRGEVRKRKKKRSKKYRGRYGHTPLSV